MKRGQKLKKCVTQMAWMCATLQGLFCAVHRNIKMKATEMLSEYHLCPKALFGGLLLTCVENEHIDRMRRYKKIQEVQLTAKFRERKFYF